MSGGVDWVFNKDENFMLQITYLEDKLCNTATKR